MFVQFCFALLALSSLTAASDPDCEELIKPLEDRSRVVGKWIYYAGTSDNKEFLEKLKIINSSWIELSTIPDSEDMRLRWGDRLGESCHHGAVNATFSGNLTKVTFYFNASDHDHAGKHLVTCSDCILWTDTSVWQEKDGKTTKGRNLYMFTKSGTLGASDLEMLKKQAACLNFPSEFHFGQTADLCPDEKEAATDAAEQ